MCENVVGRSNGEGHDWDLMGIALHAGVIRGRLKRMYRGIASVYD